MVRLITAAQAVQHGDRIVDAGFLHKNRGKPALESGVFLDVFAVFVQSCCAYTLQVAAGQSWLQHVGGIHGALRGTRANHGMQFINEQDDLTG